MKDVIYSVFGKETASSVIDLDYEYEYIKIKGVIGKPNIARSNRSNQIFFVNQRYIRDKNLSTAVEQAFKGMLPIGKFAFLVLNVEMPQSKVDVNVHPAKLEVRFSEENIVFKAMYHAIKDTLLKNGFMSDREKTEFKKEVSTNAFRINNYEEKFNNTYTIKKQEPVDENNIIEAIYNSRQEETKDDELSKAEFVASNQEIFNKLKDLQDELKKEVEQNPNLHLTDTYKEMEKEYNNIIDSINENEKNNNVIVQKSSENEVKTNTQNIKEANENVEEKIINNEQATINENIEEKNDNETDNKVQDIDELKEEIIPNTNENQKEKLLSFKDMYKKLFGKEPYGGRISTEEEKKVDSFYNIDSKIEDSNVSMFEEEEKYNKINYKFIGIAFNTYIILEINDEIYIMDQHAAHERIMYEKVKKNFYEAKEKSSQMLLLPDIITLQHKEMDIAKDNLDLFRKAGFVVDEFGENTIKLSGVPDFCIDLDTEELLKETLDEINVVARTAKQEKEEKFLATIACKAAVKANMSLEKAEVDSLMEELLKLPNPFTCPHGRPTIIKLSKYEIERKFARK